jgi:hypothetical protein
VIALLLVLDAATPAAAASAPAPVSPLAWTIAPGVTWGYVTGDNLAPGGTPSLQADIGYRTDEHTTVVAHVALGHLSGSAFDSFGTMYTYDYVPVFIAAGARAEALDSWIWGEITLGLHIDSLALSGQRESTSALGVGLTGGFDVLHRGADKFGVYIAVQSEVGGDSYEGLSLGVAYRR